MITSCIYLPDFTCVIINLFVFTCVKILVNKSVHGTRVHQNTWGECQRHENRFGKETRFQTSVINGYLVWMPAGVQTNHGGSSAHAQWFSCQNGGADVCDIIK